MFRCPNRNPGILATTLESCISFRFMFEGLCGPLVGGWDNRKLEDAPPIAKQTFCDNSNDGTQTKIYNNFSSKMEIHLNYFNFNEFSTVSFWMEWFTHSVVHFARNGIINELNRWPVGRINHHYRFCSRIYFLSFRFCSFGNILFRVIGAADLFDLFLILAWQTIRSEW